MPNRIYFWNIQAVWLFYALTAAALVIFIFGVSKHVSVWAKGIKNQNITVAGHTLLNCFREGLVGRRIFKGDIAAGIMHALLLWGFLGLFAGTVLVTVDHHLLRFLQGSIYTTFSVSLEIFGLMLLVGLIWALIRRYVQRVTRLQ